MEDSATRAELAALTTRVEKVEDDVESIFSKVNKTNENTVEISTKLNMALGDIGYLKGVLDSLRDRPNKLITQIQYTAIGTIVGTIVGALISLVLK